MQGEKNRKRTFVEDEVQLGQNHSPSGMLLSDGVKHVSIWKPWSHPSQSSIESSLLD
jgi:hypothetical protein